jgi:hypothetical protein
MLKLIVIQREQLMLTLIVLCCQILVFGSNNRASISWGNVNQLDL